MRIAFTGKGGSGKTTVASLFATLAAQDDYTVLALDADINQHLAESIGYKGKLRSMGTDAEVIKSYLRYKNPLVTAEVMHKTTPPGRGSRLLRATSDDWFIQEFATGHGGIWLAGAGDIPEGNVGVRCYHGLNGAIELVLGHMIDKQDELIIVDMTAGADAFSSSLFTKVDALVLVVEPTLKSLGVYGQFQSHMRDYDVPIVVVGNKIQDEGDKKFIEQHVGEVAAWIPISTEVRRRERGEVAEMIEDNIANNLRALRAGLLKSPIDWHRREELSHRMHRRAVEVAAIDTGFSLPDAAL